MCEKAKTCSRRFSECVKSPKEQNLFHSIPPNSSTRADGSIAKILHHYCTIINSTVVEILGFGGLDIYKCDAYKSNQYSININLHPIIISVRRVEKTVKEINCNINPSTNSTLSIIITTTNTKVNIID